MPRLIAGYVDGISAPVVPEVIATPAVDRIHTLDTLFGMDVGERRLTFGDLFTDSRPPVSRRANDRPQVLGLTDNRGRIAQLRASRK